MKNTIFVVALLGLFACTNDSLTSNNDELGTEEQFSDVPVEFNIGGDSYSAESRRYGIEGIHWNVGDTILIGQYKAVRNDGDGDGYTNRGDLLDAERYVVTYYNGTHPALAPVDDPLYHRNSNNHSYFAAVAGGQDMLAFGDSESEDFNFMERVLTRYDYDMNEIETMSYYYDFITATTIKSYDEDDIVPLEFKHVCNQFNFTILDYENSDVKYVSIGSFLPDYFTPLPAFNTKGVFKTNSHTHTEPVEHLPTINVTDENEGVNFRTFIPAGSNDGETTYDLYFWVHYNDGSVSQDSAVFWDTFEEPGTSYNFTIAIDGQGVTRSGNAERTVRIVDVIKEEY